MKLYERYMTQTNTDRDYTTTTTTIHYTRNIQTYDRLGSPKSTSMTVQAARSTCYRLGLLVRYCSSSINFTFAVLMLRLAVVTSPGI